MAHSLERASKLLAVLTGEEVIFHTLPPASQRRTKPRTSAAVKWGVGSI